MATLAFRADDRDMAHGRRIDAIRARR